MKKISQKFDELAKTNPTFEKCARVAIYGGIPIGIVTVCFGAPVLLASGLYAGALSIGKRIQKNDKK